MKALAAGFVLAMAVSAAVAAPASASPATSALGPCAYQVRYDSTAVYASSNELSAILKYKPAGSVVTGPCRRENDFTAVDCTCDPDGIGWIRTGRLL